MELLSNCCGASIDGLNADNIGICSECKEGCGVEEVLTDEEKEIISHKGGVTYSSLGEVISKLSEQKQ